MGAYAGHSHKGVAVAQASLTACMIEAGISPEDDILLLSMCQAYRTFALKSVEVHAPTPPVTPLLTVIATPLRPCTTVCQRLSSGTILSIPDLALFPRSAKDTTPRGPGGADCPERRSPTRTLT